MIYQKSYSLSWNGLFVSLICTVVVTVSGCASLIMPSGMKILPKGPDGLQRIEVSEVAPNEAPISTNYKNDTWKIEMAMPGGWKLDKELSKRSNSPFKVEFTRPNGWLTVFCWDGVSDVIALKEKTIAAIGGIDAPPELNKNVWVIPGAAQPAELYTLFGYHDAVITVPDPKTGQPLRDAKTGKILAYNAHFLKTFKIIVKPATKPGSCNYGIQLLELAPDDSKIHAETLAGHALSIARGLK
ncbi:MAG: hypothetical protein PXX77_07980 [Gallionella sp.]|nr:hypothetical protein [Gallionella sp.]